MVGTERRRKERDEERITQFHHMSLPQVWVAIGNGGGHTFSGNGEAVRGTATEIQCNQPYICTL